MKYRAKITRIMGVIENIYNLKKAVVIQDTKDIYLEVGTEQEFDLIENLNDLETERIKTIISLHEATAY